MKKYAINRLIVDVGHWCNMTCDHCMRGEREKLAFDSVYMDMFLEDIYFVNHIYFAGGEAMFYMKEIREILEIFKKKKVPINFIRVSSNILIRNEEFCDFMNDIGKYSEHPDGVRMRISKDFFHLKNMKDMGIDPEQYEETKKWYRDKLNDSIGFTENTVPDERLLIEGRAKNLDREKLKSFTFYELDIDKYKNIQVFPTTIEEKGAVMVNAFESLSISAEGYLYWYDDFSYENRRRNNYELALGHVGDESLEDMINRWNNRIKTPADMSELKVVLNDGCFWDMSKKILDINKKIKAAVYSKNKSELIKIKQILSDMMEEYQKNLDELIKNFGIEISNDSIVHAFMGITSQIRLVDSLLELPNDNIRIIFYKLAELGESANEE